MQVAQDIRAQLLCSLPGIVDLGRPQGLSEGLDGRLHQRCMKCATHWQSAKQQNRKHKYKLEEALERE
jgi:hypothetical protein